MKPILRRSLIVAALCAGLASMNYYAPLQAPSVFFDLALVAFLAGAISLLRPLRFLDIGSRREALLVILASLVTAVAALAWPAPLKVPSGPASKIDEFMPAAEFDELHTERVHATAERTWRATREMKASEIAAAATLMRIRLAAAGRFQAPRIPPNEPPMLDALSSGGSNFTALTIDEGREFVFCMVGRPWSSGPSMKVANAAEFRAFSAPNAIKVVSNIRVSDLGGGWSEVSTQTRIVGTDDAGRRVFARYWRVIYPGSAIIRRMWLKAIAARAEAPGY